MKTLKSSSHGTLLTYFSGFLLSLALTLTAFLMVKKHIDSHHLTFSDNFMLIVLSILAITQLMVQLVFFLHLDRESKPWWNMTVLVFALGTVFILVAGSIWIMDNLEYHHGSHDVTHDGHALTSPDQTNQYIIQDEGVQP
jgi:cytochrome o ubiquinol oxidase operon protein cyoD